MNKFIAQSFVVVLAVALQIIVFMKGWGLTPQSWWWVIGGGFFGVIFLRLLADKIAKEA